MYVFRDYRKREVEYSVNHHHQSDVLQNSRRSSFADHSYQSGSFLPKANSKDHYDNELNKNSIHPVETDPLIIPSMPKPLRDEHDIEQRHLNHSIEVALTVGVTLTLHTMKNSRSAKITLSDGIITCRVNKATSLKVVQIPLNEIKAVVSGKETPNFLQSNLQHIPEDVCFSIVTSSKTLDFETMYKAERDALVAGLQLLCKRQRKVDASLDP